MTTDRDEAELSSISLGRQPLQLWLRLSMATLTHSTDQRTGTTHFEIRQTGPDYQSEH